MWCNFFTGQTAEGKIAPCCNAESWQDYYTAHEPIISSPSWWVQCHFAAADESVFADTIARWASSVLCTLIQRSYHRQTQTMYYAWQWWSAVARYNLTAVDVAGALAENRRVKISTTRVPSLILQLIVFIWSFLSSNTAVIQQCRYFFHIEFPSVQLQRRFEKFLANAADDVKLY